MNAGQPEQPRFYYDFASPESYLVAERALHALGEVPEWIPVGVGSFGFRCAEEVASYQEDVERRAQELGLMGLAGVDPRGGGGVRVPLRRGGRLLPGGRRAARAGARADAAALAAAVPGR